MTVRPPATATTAPSRETGSEPPMSTVTGGAAAQVGEEQLMALLDHTSAVIYLRDVDGRYLLLTR
jgi:hypothetical protein